MQIDRRAFLRQLGIALASLVSTRCVPPLKRVTETPQVLCYEMVAPTPTPPPVTCYTVVPSPTPANELTRQAQTLKETAQAGDLPIDATRQVWAALGRERLRACWFGLDALAQRAADLEKGEWAQKSLVAEYRTALDDLVSIGELDEPVAAQVQIAFEEAAFHVWRSNTPIECYIALPVEYEPRDDLVQRAQVLSAIEGVDQTVIDQARAALERDIAFFVLLGSGQPDAAQLAKQWAAGEIAIDAVTLAAAQFLIDLLLEE